MADDQSKDDKPFAPTSFQFRYGGDEDRESMLPERGFRRRRNFIKCCGCVSAISSILATVALVLMFTVLDIKDPLVNINSVELSNGTLSTDANTTILADVSIRNPNVGPFRFNNGWLTIYCGDTVIGEARIPPGKDKAKATVHMNVTVDIIRKRLLAIQSLRRDVISGALSLSARTMVEGKVRVIISKPVVAKDNCNVTYHISSHKFQVED